MPDLPNVLGFFEFDSVTIRLYATRSYDRLWLDGLAELPFYVR